MIKYLLQLYLNIIRHLTSRYFVFLKQAIKTNSMLCFNQFLLPILNSCLLRVLYIVIEFDDF